MKYSGFFRNFRMCSDNIFRGWKFREAKRASSIETSRKLSGNGFICSTNEFDVSHTRQDSTTSLHAFFKKQSDILSASVWIFQGLSSTRRQQKRSQKRIFFEMLSKEIFKTNNTRNSIMMMLCTEAYDMRFILCRANTTNYFFVLS